MGRLPALMGVVLAVAAGCLDAPASEAASAAPVAGAFELEGSGCVELAVIVSVPAENARRHVPPEFRILGEETGFAGVMVGTILCAQGTVGGFALGPHLTGEISVGIEGSGAPDEVATYVVQWPTDSAALAMALRDVGWIAADASTGGFARSGALVEEIAVAVTLAGSSYTARGSFAAPDAILPAHTSAWWNATDGSAASGHFAVAQGVMKTGTGAVSADAGSVLADLIGGTEATGVALFVGFDYSGPVATADA